MYLFTKFQYKPWYFADLFPYGVMGDQQGLIGGNQ